jgi:hypothetical protein
VLRSNSTICHRSVGNSSDNTCSNSLFYIHIIDIDFRQYITIVDGFRIAQQQHPTSVGAIVISDTPTTRPEYANTTGLICAGSNRPLLLKFTVAVTIERILLHNGQEGRFWSDNEGC